MVNEQLMNFVSRLRQRTNEMVVTRKELKSLKEEFNELGMASRFDPAVWNGDNPELGEHRHIRVQDLGALVAALDEIEAVLANGHLASLLKMK